MRRSTMGLIVGMLVTGSGCHRSPSVVVPYSERVFVVVANNFTQSMEVLVVASGASHRLGSVNPSMEGRFEVPQAALGAGPLSFVAHPTGAATPSDARLIARPGELLVSRGQTVEFIISNPLFNSTVTIRP